MVRSKVRRGRPDGRRLQSLGNPRIDVYRALDVSCESPIRATCPRLYRESGEYVGDTCCQRQQSCLPELGSRPMFQNRRGGSLNVYTVDQSHEISTTFEHCLECIMSR